MSDQSDSTSNVIMVSCSDLATEVEVSNISNRTRSKSALSNNCGSPKISKSGRSERLSISTPRKNRSPNKITGARTKTSLRLEEKFPTIFQCNKEKRNEFLNWLKNNEDFNKIAIYINSESITAQKLYDLYDKDNWLSSDHINAYLSYLNMKFHHVFSLPSFFYTKLTKTGRYEYSSVIRWTKKTEIFQKEIIFVPINLDESHWILAAIFMKDQRRIAILDSLGILADDNAVTIGKNLIRWLNDEYRHKRNVRDEDVVCEDYKIKNNLKTPDPDSNEATSITISGEDPWLADTGGNFTLDIMFRNHKPPQSDGSSCGVFVCMFARLMAENIGKNEIIKIVGFQEANRKFRKVMCTDLWNHWNHAGENEQMELKREEKPEEYVFSP